MPIWLVSFFAKPLVKAAWKYVVGGILIALLVWFGVHKWNAYKDSIYQEGRQAGRAEVTMEYKKIIDSNDATNRRVEQKVGEAVEHVGAKVDVILDRLNLSERKVATTIINAMAKDPRFTSKECSTPQDIMDARNEIRRMGPSGK